MLNDLSLGNSYKTSSSDMLADFYIPCLANSTEYSRATGYFSSALLSLAPVAFADFFERGGHIRLACSPQLTIDDASTLMQSSSSSGANSLNVALRELQLLANSSFDLRGSLARALSSLVNAGSLELQLVMNEIGSGIYHDKYGIFQDLEGEQVSFIGSANESAAAWSGTGNHEQIEVFSSKNLGDRGRITGHADGFERLWSGVDAGLELMPPSEAGALLTSLIPPEPVADILREVRSRVRDRISVSSTKMICLRKYQEQAIKAWKDGGRRGIISFATGGGKTLTALSALQEWLSDGGVGVVLVPSRLLMSQWISEIRSWLSDVLILEVGGTNPKSSWSQDLFRFTQRGLPSKRLVVATYVSAASNEFRERLDLGPHLMVVGDEVHRFGAPNTMKMAEWMHPGAALGLSATPERFGDPEGTQIISDVFGPIIEPVFTLSDAINGPDKVLVPYDYYFEDVELSDDEQFEWDQLSLRIQQDWAINQPGFSESGRLLLIQRARIAKRAIGKAAIAAKIVQENFRLGDRWLVYCEGLDHLRDVRTAISSLTIQGLTIMEYHSQNDEEHMRVLDFFRERGGLLLAIKCLDEGVDIPVINRAIVLSSSSNPREYIQRRGRILRRFPGKDYAQLWDILTFNVDGRPVSVTELTRASEFAETSRNRATKIALADLLHEFEYMFEFDKLEKGFEEDLNGDDDVI
jgi:superfamily II DNA or RNA helicase